MTTPSLAGIFGYRLDDDQFQQLVSVKDAIQRTAEAVTRLAPPLVRFRVIHKKSGFIIEGANLKMNLKNNHEIEFELVFTNAQGGPARVDEDSIKWSGVTETGAFSIEPNPTNKRRCLVRGNPLSPGGEADIGVLHCEFDGDAGDGVLPRVGEGAINVIAGDAEIVELRAIGESRPQTTAPGGTTGGTTDGTDTGTGTVNP